jgi:hypothetical protein
MKVFQRARKQQMASTPIASHVLPNMEQHITERIRPKDTVRIATFRYPTGSKDAPSARRNTYSTKTA